RRSQIGKQADALMLVALLDREFELDQQRRNFDYYEPRCGHGSSLSASVHALVAARAGKTGKAQDYFRQTAAIDLKNTFVNGAGGLHMAALGGLWQTAVFGFGGLQARDGRLFFTPALP